MDLNAVSLTIIRLPHRLPARQVRLASNGVPVFQRGRNLSERYRRLENNTRAQCERAGHVPLLSQVSKLSSDVAHAHARTHTPPNTIAGFTIPKEPRAPADDECCMSGCAVCVYDLYEDALAAYKESVVTLRSTLSGLHIPESEWPAHIRISKETNPSPKPILTMSNDKSKGAVFSAFDEMERALKEKRDKRAAGEAEKKARGEVLAGDGAQVGLDLRGVYEGIKWVIFPNR